MTDYAKSAKVLMDVLELKTEPVAVTLIKKGEALPEGYQVPEKNIRHCQSIMRARRGEKLLLTGEKHACVVGGSALGILPIPDKVKSGEFHFNIGMFDTVEAAKKMIEERPQLECGSVMATAVSPLSETKIKPDVVIVTGTPEQMYWLLPVAAKFFQGGKMVVEMEPFQASCAYSTVYPYLHDTLSLSIGCFGCRKSTDLEPSEMLVGIPASKLDEVVAALERLVGPRGKSKIKTG
ncbi:MAG TPA: DUF169 domain-containing protein [Methanomassiliicoccales archaeon]|nr:DUF169 domain-containing protein [Methanomassiliicoccales archaeon]